MRFEATIDVAAPAQLVFEAYTDVERWPEWPDLPSRNERRCSHRKEVHHGPLQL